MHKLEHKKNKIIKGLFKKVAGLLVMSMLLTLVTGCGGEEEEAYS